MHGFSVEVHPADFQVKVSKREWLDLVSNKFWSTFSYCTVDELNEGLSILKDRFAATPSTHVSFNDRTLFLAATKI